MAMALRSPIIQITNISPSCSLEQIRMLFGNIGVIEELVVYPPEGDDCPSKVCFIKFADAINAEVALHLHNTMFLDRALIILPVVTESGTIPDEKYAELVRAPLHTSAGIHPRSALWPLDVISMVVGRPGEQVIQTIDPQLSSMGFPAYPPLPAATDCNRIEEIRRTVLVTNLDPKLTCEQVLEFFNNHAEVKCVRMAGSDDERAAYVEFTEQASVVKAFGLMGTKLGDRQIMVQHSNCAIIKPNSSLAGLEDTIKKTNPRSANVSTSGRIKSRSRSRSRRRSPSRSRRRRSRSRSKRRLKSRSPRRSTSRRRTSGDRSRSRRERRSRVRSPSTHRSSRQSRSRDRRRRSRERREKERRERHERDKARRERRSRSRSKHRENGKDRKEKRHDSKRDEKKLKERSVSHRSNRDKAVTENGKSKSKEVVEPTVEEPANSTTVEEMAPPSSNTAKDSTPVESIMDPTPVDLPKTPKKPVGVKLADPEEEDIQG